MELIRHPYDSASGVELQWDPEAHELMGEYPWLVFLRRFTNTPRLMVYRHKFSDRFILGIWVWSPEEAQRPIVCEVKGFEDTPRRLWPKDLPPPNVLGQILKPVDEVVEQRKKNRAREAYEKAQEKEELAASKTEAINYYLRKGMDEEAHVLKFSPWRKPREDTQHFIKATRNIISKEGF